MRFHDGGPGPPAPHDGHEGRTRGRRHERPNPLGPRRGAPPPRPLGGQGRLAFASASAWFRTPSGSFQGSNLDTWVTRGRSVRTPIHSSTRRAVSSGRWRFFGLHGSIAGGMTWIRGMGASAGANCSIVKMPAASYSARRGRRKVQTEPFGWDVSMWQRQTHRALPFPRSAGSAAGCGSWTKTKSYSSSKVFAFSCEERRNVASPEAARGASDLRSGSGPRRALGMRLARRLRQRASRVPPAARGGPPRPGAEDQAGALGGGGRRGHSVTGCARPP